MPLRDHFHPPVSVDVDWESVHSSWVNTVVRVLNEGLQPDNYRAQPEVRFGQELAIDVATFEQQAAAESADSGNGVAVATWAPGRAATALAITSPGDDLFEVKVYDRHRGRRLVAAVEVVSPSNKDRPASRRDFAIKCAGYLQALVAVVIVDVVTDRLHDLYRELLGLLSHGRTTSWPGEPPLYAVALRSTKAEKEWRVETWEEPLALGRPLPTMPLWLADNLAVPLDLEATYEEACRVLRLT